MGQTWRQDAAHRQDHGKDARARTIFPNTLRPADSNVLKPGGNQRKIGSRVRKGPWRKMPIYCLTLEERATCPRTCRQWATCYGSNMQWATRYQHGADLERELARELAELNMRHRRGFVVRLHILGDFYSRDYVRFWEGALRALGGLHIFGYTHWQASTPIGAEIARIRDVQWERFAVRHSDALSGPRTKVIRDAAHAGDAIVCPAQTGKTANCSTCGLCWAPAAKDKVIAFLEH